MESLILELKREIGVVNSLIIYDTYAQNVAYSDSQDETSIKTIQSMIAFGCLDDLSYLFLDLENTKYLLTKEEKLVSIMELKDKPLGNQIIVIHKTKLFLKQYHNTIFK